MDRSTGYLHCCWIRILKAHQPLDEKEGQFYAGLLSQHYDHSTS